MVLGHLSTGLNMSEQVQQSLVVRTGLALAAVILLAMVNMVASYLTAESTENDAVRINLAGSLRMQSYRITNEFILARVQPGRGRQQLEQAVTEFEERLYRAVLADHIGTAGNADTQRAFNTVTSGWHRLKPLLLSAAIPQPGLLRQVDAFVDDIDLLVKNLELQTESKFKVLRFIQGASLVMTLGLAAIMFYNVYKYVVGPLHQLVIMASRVRTGDFSMRLDSSGEDELSLLAATFNDMAESLEEMYRGLENKVQAKTRHLEDIQEALRFLYDCSRRLSAEGNIVEKLDRTIHHLQRQLDAQQVDLLLLHETPDHPFLISTSTRVRTMDTDCDPPRMPENSEGFERYPLQHDNRNYGSLQICLGSTSGYDKEQHLLLTALADNIGAALANEVRKDQEHRVALMDERAAIARDLHDSLAQSLSFTKIQISRFQALQGRSAPQEQLDEALLEIKNGIQSAYRQLRELLATFRLQLDSPGLQASLAATAREFENKGKLGIELSYELQNVPLTPNEEIHILQIVREALSNVLRHSGADSARIELKLAAGSTPVVVTVTDNGSGFSEASADSNHYGQTIMRERAEILGGSIEFFSPPTGGAQVRLSFVPEQSATGAAPESSLYAAHTLKLANQ
jgi:two-component system nitrate/nitrite sensor histidine kinase NarX